MSLAGLLTLFAAVTVTWLAVSGPGEAALVSAGAVAAHGHIDLTAVLAVAFAGTLAGSAIAYGIGRVGGRRLLLWTGPFHDRRVRMLARSEALVRRRAFLASVVAPGWLVGINAVRPRAFLAGAAVSGALWTLAMGIGSFFLGPSIARWMSTAGTLTVALGLAAAGCAALVFVARRARSRRAVLR